MVRNLETIFSIITKQYDDTDDVNDIINDLNTNTLTIRNDDNEWRAIWFLTGVQKNVRVEKHLPWSLVYADKVCTTKLQREDCDLMGNVRFQFYSGSSISDVMSRLTFEVRFMYLGEKEWRCIPLKMNDGFAEAHIDILFPTARLNYHDINFEYRVRNISNLQGLIMGIRYDNYFLHKFPRQFIRESMRYNFCFGKYCTTNDGVFQEDHYDEKDHQPFFGPLQVVPSRIEAQPELICRVFEA